MQIKAKATAKVLHTLQINFSEACLLLACTGNGLEILVLITRNTEYLCKSNIMKRFSVQPKQKMVREVEKSYT